MDHFANWAWGYVVGRSAESVARTMANKPVNNNNQENG
jgi:hypothetical protein